MDAVLDVLVHAVLPAVFFVGAGVFIVFELIRRRRLARNASPAPREPTDKPRTSHALAPLFERLRATGIEVCEQVASPSRVPFRVALLIGHESVYMCSCCGQRGKVAFGEAYAADSGRCGTVWIGHLCGHCGFVDRYRDAADVHGFFSATLDHGSTLLDVVVALEAQAGVPLAHRVQAVLAEREAVFAARSGAVRALRDDIAARTGAARAHPFRGWSGHAPFKA